MKINHLYIKYQIKNLETKLFPLIQKLTQLEKRFISPRLIFAQIYKLQGYGQYKIHGNVINVPTNVDQTQSILPHLPHDGATIGVLQDLIETPSYKYLNVNIHHQWASLFTLHVNLKSQIPAYNNASSDNFDSDNEKIHCTPIDSMIHNFLDAPKIMDYENTIYFITPS